MERLPENPIIVASGTQKSKLLGLITIESTVSVELDSNSGEIIEINEPWYDFLTTESESQIQDNEIIISINIVDIDGLITSQEKSCPKDCEEFVEPESDEENYKPEGYIDYISESGLIVGWSYDQNLGENPNQIHYYLDGEYLSYNIANENRPDVNDAKGYGENHGFEYQLNGLNLGAHSISAYAINYPSGDVENPLLGTKSFFVLKDGSYKEITEEKPIVFILSGQSNMYGTANYSNLKGKDETDLIEIPYNVDFYYAEPHLTEIILINLENSELYSDKKTYFGPEISLIHELAEKYPNRQVKIVKFAVGGTDIRLWSPDPDEADDRVPNILNAMNLDSSSAYLFERLYEKLINHINAAVEDSPSVEYGGMFWFQGESDIGYGDYLVSAEKMIGQIREDLGAIYMPFFMGKIHPGDGGCPWGTEIEIKDGIAKIRDLQGLAESTIDNTYVIDSKDLSCNLKEEYPVHFNEASLIILGNRFGDRYDDYLNNKINNPEEPIVFILSGQSNMLGFGNVDNLENANLLTIPDNVKFYYADYTDFNSESLNLINSINDEIHSSFKTNLPQFGPEISLIHELAEKYPNRQVIIVKFAVGGTDIYKWSPGAKFLYDKLTEYIESSVQDYPSVEYGGMFWFQGEQDATIFNKDYQSLTEELIEQIRDDLKSENMPFIMGKIHPATEDSSCPWAINYNAIDNVESIRQMQESIASKKDHVYLVNSDNLACNKVDFIHFDESSIVTLGELFGDRYDDYLTSK
jgi:hypothetical protein